MTDQGRDIDRKRLFAKACEEFGDVCYRASTVAGDERGDAHAYKIFACRIVEDILHMRVYVDEPRRDDLVLCVDKMLCLSALNASDLNDPAIFYCDRPAEPRVAGTIDDACVTDDEVVARFGLREPRCR